MKAVKGLLSLALVIGFILWTIGSPHLIKPLPEGLSLYGPERVVTADEVEFLFDLTARLPESGEVWIRQEIFDRVIDLIEEAEEFVLADFFLVNEFAGETWGPPLPAVTAKLLNALAERRMRDPGLPMLLITDPLNTVYNGVDNTGLSGLEAAGVPVVYTDLRKLPDSNIPYSPVWRAGISWWLAPGGGFAVGNPLAEGKVGIGSLLELLNFKANHRKVLAVGGERPMGVVTSANPHTASGLHGNVALLFGGPAVVDLVESELAVPGMENRSVTAALREWIRNRPQQASTTATVSDQSATVRVLTERPIKDKALKIIDSLQPGDKAELALFYFSDVALRQSLERAARRGVRVRMVLDPNKDAFGRPKNGIPNRQTAYYLTQAGADVRWYATGGEQFHTKMALFHRINEREIQLLIGSANWTRRNLNDLNLETNVLLRGQPEFPALQRASDYFNMIWSGRPGPLEGLPPLLLTTVDYDEYADERRSHRLLYQIMERSGLSTF